MKAITSILRARYITLLSLIGLFSLSSPISANPELNGIAAHTELGKDQFIGALYLTTLTTNSKDALLAREAKQIEVRVVAQRFSSRRFKRMWIEGMAINASSVELANQSKNMAAFSNMLKIKLQPGDIFSIDRDRQMVEVKLNQVTLGIIEDPTFFDLLLRSWIGPVPLSGEFRDDLMQAGKTDGALLANFEATGPTKERVAAITAGIASLKDQQESADNSTSAAPAAAAVIKSNDLTPSIAAPTIEIPRPAAAEPASDKPTIDAPTIDAPTIAAPSIDNTTQENAPANNATSDTQPTEVAAASPPTESSIFEDDDEEEFTAVTLLEQQLYIAQLKRWSQKFLTYPQRALNRGHEGNVRLEVTLNREGKVLNVTPLEESRYRSLNKAANTAVQKASPFPEIPPILTGNEFTFTLPIAYKLQKN